MKKDLLFIIVICFGALLVLLNIGYGIAFLVHFLQSQGGSVVFLAAMHLNLLITLIVLNTAYLIALVVFFFLRFKAKGGL